MNDVVPEDADPTVPEEVQEIMIPNPVSMKQELWNKTVMEIFQHSYDLLPNTEAFISYCEK